MKNRLLAGALIGAVTLVATVASTALAAPAKRADTRLSLVAYSTPREA